MDDNSLVWAAVVIAVIAVVGRLLINRQRKGTVDWFKIFLVLAALASSIVGYALFDAHSFFEWLKGEATLEDSRRENIAGRPGKDDVRQYSSADTVFDYLYYRIKADAIEPTGSYKLKTDRPDEEEVDRKTIEGEGGKTMIERKRTNIDLTRNPSKADLYIPIYCVTTGNAKILVALEPRNANPGYLPVGKLCEASAKMSRLASQTDSLLCRSDVYFMCFNSQAYDRNATKYIIYKAVAGVIFAFVVVLALLCVKRISPNVKK